MSQFEENLLDTIDEVHRKDRQANDQYADHFNNEFQKAHEMASQRYDMLEKLVEQMQISNAMSAIQYKMQNSGAAMTPEQRTELDQVYSKLSDKAIEDGKNLVNTRTNVAQRGHEFDSMLEDPAAQSELAADISLL